MESLKSFTTLTTARGRACFLFLFLIISQQSMAIISARSLGNPSTVDHHHHHHHHHRHHYAQLAFSFYIVDVLAEEKHQYPSSKKPSTTGVNGGQLPFSKPLLGLFPPIGGIPLTVPADSVPVTGLPYQTLDLQGTTVSFPATASLYREELELGTVTTVNEDIYQGPVYGSPFLGKAQGIYVASSEAGSSHMMAIILTLIRDDEYNGDGLRLFGVHRTDVKESHVAVIGGTGKYRNANGYATIETVNGSYSTGSVPSNRDEGYKLLHFKVYLG